MARVLTKNLWPLEYRDNSLGIMPLVITWQRTWGERHSDPETLVRAAQALEITNSIAQIATEQNPNDWDIDVRGRKKTMLHLVAENDLIILGEMVLDGTLFRVISR